MATTVFETFGVIRPDGTLDLEQKLAPMPGRVKVRVEFAEAELAEPTIESAEDLGRRFTQLVATWRNGTRHCSKIKTMREHPAYQEIVAMGEKAVPLILAQLEKEAGFLFLALEDITGASPTPEKGNSWIEELAAAWLAWGRAKGYRWVHVV